MEEKTLLFDEQTHTYLLDGHEIPSVTQIMKVAGIIDGSFYNDVGRLRGSAVHLATQYLDEGELNPENGALDWASLDAEITPYVHAYVRFKQESGFVPEMIEKRVLHTRDVGKPPCIAYAGTLDRTGHFPCTGSPSGSYAILDIKTGSIPKWAGIQLAAYAHALPPEIPIRRFALQLKNTGKYKLQEFKDTDDYMAFYGACHIVQGQRLINQWRVKNGKSN